MQDSKKVYDFCKIGDFERLAISKLLYQIADNEMQTLAKTSGGKVFQAGSLSESRNAFQKVADEIGTKYSLGYYSNNEKRDGKYRRIKVEFKNLPKGTQIRAREGYNAPQKLATSEKYNGRKIILFSLVRSFPKINI